VAQDLPVVVVLKEHQAEEHLILVQGPERGGQKTQYLRVFVYDISEYHQKFGHKQNKTKFDEVFNHLSPDTYLTFITMARILFVSGFHPATRARDLAYEF
jgi:hypothetical protein